LWRGFWQITKTAPLRRMTLHFSHIGFTEARTFIAPVSYRKQDSRTPHESDGRREQWPKGPTGKDSRGACLGAGPRRAFRKLLDKARRSTRPMAI
jgi:hypothetical protein